ncbi:restriction endonuclease subunit S [Phocaeicola dorei]|uniref:restriction endonuclease subunit S n=1 Tax=Phocaeicola dorei TaxID=357276 RepID=UPI001F47DCD8|nr:restriction endonuclease subunit S [Phocaeicola dorei]MCE9456856.1 restriction endonuclease subunit S [Phocaeicola dorei]
MDTKALRQKILDLAIHGKLVPQDPNDEPASVLLERIKAEKERLIKEGKIKRGKKSAKTSDTPHYSYLLPKGWEWCKLEDIVSFGGGKTPSMDNKEYWDNGKHLWVTSKDMKCSHITNSLMKITKKALEEMTLYEKGTLLVVTRSGILRHTLPLSILEKPATVNQDLKTISPHIQELSEYLYVIIKANEHIILKEYHKDGTTVDSIDFDKFRCLPIPLAPIAEQKRIIATAKNWFSLIDQIEQGKADLQTIIKQTKSKILDLAIHGKLVPQDPNDEPPIELLKRINPDFKPCDNGHYTQLPDGWCVVTLKDLCENINGLWKGKKEPFVNVGVIRNANFTKDFKLDYSNIEYIDVEQRTFAKRHLENGDLIVEKSGGSDNNPVGRTILYEGKSGVFSFSNFTMALRTRNNDIVLSKFLYYYILAKYQKGDMRLMQTQTTGLRNLILDKFLSMPIHLPPLSEQKRIIDRIETIFTSLDMIMGSL